MFVHVSHTIKCLSVCAGAWFAFACFFQSTAMLSYAHLNTEFCPNVYSGLSLVVLMAMLV